MKDERLLMLCADQIEILQGKVGEELMAFAVRNPQCCMTALKSFLDTSEEEEDTRWRYKTSKSSSWD